MYSVVLDSILKRFGPTVAVEDFNLQVEEGELITLLGPSGCGKTTTLRIIAGFEKPDEGKVYIYDQEVSSVPAERREVGMVFQNYALFPHMTVRQNVAFPMMVKKKPKAEIRSHVREYLSLVKIEELEDRYIQQLSGGQRQRVALARALAKEPKILLLDEPLSALDAKIRVKLRGEIRKLQQKLSVTAIYVTHDQEEALSVSDRVVVMNEGRIEQLGSPAEIYNRPISLFVSGFVGTMNLFRGEVIHTDGGPKLRWHDQLLELAETETASPDSEVTMAVRPESMTIVHQREEIPDGSNAVRGTVKFVIFLGTVTRVEAQTAEGQLLRVDLLGSQDLHIGEEIYACFPTKAGVIIQDHAPTKLALARR